MIKAVIFDMDGLMADTEMISFKGFQAILNKYGFPFSLEDYKKDFPGKQLSTSLNFIKEHYHIDLDIDKETVFFQEEESKHFKEGVPLKDSLVPLLQYLKKHNYKTVMATSSSPSRAEKILKSHNIMKYFDDCVYGREVKNGKPHPDIFIKACEKLQVLPEDSLVLEDSEAGIQAAYNAHIPVICIPDLKYPTQKYVDMTYKIYPSLHDVLELLINQDIVS